MKNIIDFIKSLFAKNASPEAKDSRFALVPSPVDYRDVNVKDVLGSIIDTPLPETYMIPFALPVKDQSIRPSCVGQSCASIKDFKERLENNDVDFDGDWIYQQCKLIDGMPNVQGTYFRIGLKILKDVGAKPFTGGDPSNFKIGGFAKVDCDWDSLKRAIYKYGPILAGFNIYAGGSWNDAYIKRTSSTIAAGHAVVLVGWDKNYLIGQNSFGLDWGDRSKFYVPMSYLPFESWAVVNDLPTELLPNEAEKPHYVFESDLYLGVNNPDDVRMLQDCLKYLGCFPKEQVSTGYFGAKTFEAVKLFQSRYNIEQLGRVGPATRKQLNILFS